MRLASSLFALAALAFAQPALATPVAIAPVAFSEDFQSDLDEEYGVREADELRAALAQSLHRAFARRGDVIAESSPLSVEITIVDAAPNRPTFKQLSERPGLDMLRSISLGGAELHATLRGADGQILREVEHRRYDSDLREIMAATTWTAARRAIRQFAEKVADAAQQEAP